MRRVFLAIILCVGAVAAQAEIVKTADIDCHGRICFHWWPKLAPLPGWHADENVNRRYGFNALIPDGASWSGADTIMYARAVYRESRPDIALLDAFIASDKKSFADEKGTLIADAAPVTTGDGAKLRSATYFRVDHKTWERVSYGEEGDYFLLFVVSSFSETAYEKRQADYEQMIRTYHR
jgi:hypothetical protein